MDISIMNSLGSMPVRPLGFGELFDRAITLYMRNLLPFVGIAAVLLVPGAIVQYLAAAMNSESISEFWQILQHPGVKPAVPDTTPSAALLAGIILLGLVIMCMQPFVMNAIAYGIARIYRGEQVEFRACYAQSLRHWPRVIGLLFLDLLVGLGWYIAFVLLLLAVGIFVGLIAANSQWLAIFIGIFGGLLALAAFCFLAPLLAVFAFSMYAVIFEEQGVIAALGSGFGRIFSRNEFWRAFGVLICAGLIAITASSVVSIVSLIALFFKFTLFYVFVNSLANALIAPFSIVLLAVYYFDVRLRRGELSPNDLPSA